MLCLHPFVFSLILDNDQTQFLNYLVLASRSYYHQASSSIASVPILILLFLQSWLFHSGSNFHSSNHLLMGVKQESATKTGYEGPISRRTCQEMSQGLPKESPKNQNVYRVHPVVLVTILNSFYSKKKR